jgi:hypothetical protein
MEIPMRTSLVRTFELAAVALLLAASAQAQGNSHDKDKGNRGDRGGAVKVPPGLAKKPGQMPPGQYKKRYGTNEGATVLGDILRRRGYQVVRVAPAGQSQYVYYRWHNGAQRRAIVSPGSDRLQFSNVPTSLLQEVLAKLY